MRLAPVPLVVTAEVWPRFERKFVQCAATGCWLWQGAKKAEGYGRFSVAGKNRLAHRVSYTLAVGPIPRGLDLDHSCRNPACVNPAHLEPVTQQENCRRQRRVAPDGRALCPQGHELDGLRRHRGATYRCCKICRRLQKGRRRARVS